MKLKQYTAIAVNQYGLVTRDQLADSMSPGALDYLLRAGYLIRVRKNVYRIFGSTDTWQQRLSAVCLTNDQYVVSHRAAAKLWGLGNHWKSELLEFSTGRKAKHQLSSVVLHKSVLPEHHITTKDGLRVTTTARTIVDLAATSQAVTIERALDHALSLRMVKLEEVEDALVDVWRPGRPSLSKITDILAARKEYESHSPLERRVLGWIAAHSFPIPVTQLAVSTRHCTYRLDIAFPDQLVGVECDGFIAHGQRIHFDNDAQRSSALAACGWRIIHVTTRTYEAEFVADLQMALKT